MTLKVLMSTDSGVLCNVPYFSCDHIGVQALGERTTEGSAIVITSHQHDLAIVREQCVSFRALSILSMLWSLKDVSVYAPHLRGRNSSLPL